MLCHVTKGWTGRLPLLEQRLLRRCQPWRPPSASGSSTCCSAPLPVHPDSPIPSISLCFMLLNILMLSNGQPNSDALII